MKKDNVSVKFKDNVFCMLYRDKNNLLELYNALNDTTYTDVDGLSVTTLSGGVYMKYKNDASFVFGQDLYMFEQQASMNPNMPLRFLHYVSDVYRDLYSNSELHKHSMIKIPVPHFVTFYNGRDVMKEEEIVLKLSDMYEYDESESELELKVRVININFSVGDGDDSSNQTDNRIPDILEKCQTLRDYMIFVNKVNEKKYSEKKDIRMAVTEAVDECITSGVLSGFFSEHREEVIDVSIYDYDEEGHKKILKEEGSMERLISLIVKKVKKNKDIDTIASELEEETETIKPLYDAVVAAAPDYDMNKIFMSISY